MRRWEMKVFCSSLVVGLRLNRMLGRFGQCWVELGRCALNLKLLVSMNSVSPVTEAAEIIRLTGRYSRFRYSGDIDDYYLVTQ